MWVSVSRPKTFRHMVRKSGRQTSNFLINGLEELIFQTPSKGKNRVTHKHWVKNLWHQTIGVYMGNMKPDIGTLFINSVPIMAILLDQEEFEALLSLPICQPKQFLRLPLFIATSSDPLRNYLILPGFPQIGGGESGGLVTIFQKHMSSLF